MKRLMLAIVVAAAPLLAYAQGAPVVANPDHEAMLRSPNPQLAKNKRLVYDFWREVVEAGHVELTEKYTTEDYIQHNPNFASGRQVLIDMFSRSRKPTPIKAKVERPIVAIIAEGDLVMMSFVNELPDPKDKTKKYTTTGITFFRVTDGKLSEHWDTGTKNAN